MKKNKVFSETRKNPGKQRVLLIMKMTFTFLLLVMFQLYTIASASQQQRVTGKVTDASTGEALPGVNVIIHGTATGVMTDNDGNFQLEVPSADAVLDVSFIGYDTQSITVGTNQRIDIALVPALTALNEVVVIGYGTTRRQNFTGSVSSVDLETSPVRLGSSTNAIGLLRGITPGMTVSQTTNAGDSPIIQIRGQKSIGGGSSASQPLIVVDGVIFSGTLNDLEPNDIANVQVLKDATSLAAYGSKAAAGVLMITMKKGKRGKPVFNFISDVTLTYPGLKPKVRDGAGYVELMSYRTTGTPDADPSTFLGALEYANYQADKQTDWIDMISRTGVMQKYALSFSAATDNSNYYISGTHLRQQGNYKGDDYSRNTFNARITTDINEYIQINANTMFSANRDWGTAPSYTLAAVSSPYWEPYLEDGVTMRQYIDNKEVVNTHPLWNTFNGVDNESKGYTNVYGGAINIKIPWIDGLSYRITGSYTIRSSESERFTHETNFSQFGTGAAGQTTEYYDTQLINANGSTNSSKNVSWDLDNIITYIKQLNDHYINASLVYTRNSVEINSRSISGSDFRGLGNTSLGIYDLTNAAVQQISSYDYSLHNDIGYLGRIIYSFKDTYTLSASVRRDGSSVFGSGMKWGVFPAVGVAWTISNEGFMSGITAINNLKLKGSWGVNGRQSLSPYRTLSTLNMGVNGRLLYFLGDAPFYGQSIARLGNPNLGWEETAAFNYGFEGDFVKRLHVEVNMYNSKTTNQIFSRVVPIMGSGISSQDATLGRVDNFGIEAEVTNMNINRKDFTWQTSFYFTLNRNKLVELYGDGQDDIPSGYFLDHSLGAIYGYTLDGIVNAGEEHYVSNLTSQLGDAQFKDISGPDGVPDGALTPDDRSIIGYGKENFTLNMANTINYKGFSMYILFTGTFSGGKDKYGIPYGMASNNDAYYTATGFLTRNILDHPFWTAENQSETYPRYDYYDTNRFLALQAYGNVRLQNVNLSYTFDNQLLRRYGINGLQLYVTSSNLFVIAPGWDFTDPDTRSYTQAQIPRTYQFGLNVKF